jgi:hypothetical protein
LAQIRKDISKLHLHKNDKTKETTSKMPQHLQSASKKSSVREKCASIFQGNCLLYTADDENAWPLPVHHQTPDSFEAAVESGCVLCHRMWNEVYRRGRGELFTIERATIFSR